jgi:hypothetical protein
MGRSSRLVAPAATSAWSRMLMHLAVWGAIPKWLDAMIRKWDADGPLEA